jgi:hypothetical protein
MGALCNFPCSEGFFGRNCSEPCRCTEHGSCDPVEGVCQCKPGFTEGTTCHVEGEVTVNLDLQKICLFVCFESHEQFFSYLVTVTITGDGAANLDLCLALTAFSSEGSFTCHTYCDTGPPFLRSYPKDP